MSNPLRSFITANGYLLRGRLRFPAARTGTGIMASDGRVFTIFREVQVSNGPEQTGPEFSDAVFEVWFTLKSMSARANRLFSWLPVPFFTGLPGFRAKLWATDEATGACYGRYRWDTVADAEFYAASYAMAFMMRRAVAGSVSYRITPVQEFDGDS